MICGVLNENQTTNGNGHLFKDKIIISQYPDFKVKWFACLTSLFWLEEETAIHRQIRIQKSRFLIFKL